MYFVTNNYKGRAQEIVGRPEKLSTAYEQYLKTPKAIEKKSSTDLRQELLFTEAF